MRDSLEINVHFMKHRSDRKTTLTKALLEGACLAWSMMNSEIVFSEIPILFSSSANDQTCHLVLFICIEQIFFVYIQTGRSSCRCSSGIRPETTSFLRQKQDTCGDLGDHTNVLQLLHPVHVSGRSVSSHNYTFKPLIKTNWKQRVQADTVRSQAQPACFAKAWHLKQ